MTITVSVPDKLGMQARMEGISIEALVERLVAQAIERNPQEEQEYKRKAVQALRAFGKTYGLTLGEGVKVADLIQEGHRY